MHLLKYGVEAEIVFPVINRGAADFAATGDWTPAVADCKISKDGGDVADCDNTIAAVGGAGSVLWTITLTATEMQAAYIVLQIVDSATKVIEDQSIVIETYGNASARHAFDLDEGNFAEIADVLMRMTTATIEAAAGGVPDDRTLYGVLAGLMHRRTRSATEIVLYQADDSTVLVTIPITQDGSLNPVDSIDPP